MGYSRGDVVLIPFPFTDLSATKTRPTVVVSSAAYHRVRPELLLAYVSSQVSKADPVLDYVLADWALAGLPRPSFVRPKIAAVEPSLIVHTVGRLSAGDMFEVDRRLWQAIGLADAAIKFLVDDADLSAQPPTLIQMLAEKSLAMLLSWGNAQTAGVDIDRLRTLLAPPKDIDI
jgi:mRNA interferase MazF